jgi:hypothetical protein
MAKLSRSRQACMLAAHGDPRPLALVLRVRAVATSFTRSRIVFLFVPISAQVLQEIGIYACACLHIITHNSFTYTNVQVLFLEMMRPDTPTDAAPRSSSPAHAHAGQQHAGVGYNQVACMSSCKEASLDTRIDHRHSYRQIFTRTRMQDEIHTERGRQTMVYASFTGVALTIPT